MAKSKKAASGPRDGEMQIEALQGCKHMKAGKKYIVSKENGKHLIDKKWAKAVNG